MMKFFLNLIILIFLLYFRVLPVKAKNVQCVEGIYRVELRVNYCYQVL